MHTINEILDNIIKSKGLKNDTALAKLLKVKPTTVSNWRKRSTIPYNLIISLCEQEGWSLNWLLTGQVEAEHIKTGEDRGHIIDTKPKSTEQHQDREPHSYGPYNPYSPQELNKTLKEFKADFAREILGAEGPESFDKNVPKWKIIAKLALVHNKFPELQTILEAFLEVITSDNEGMKLALTQNTLMFQQAVRDGQKVAKLESDIEDIKKVLRTRETDFKTQEAPGASEHPGEKHRAGGK